MFYVVITILYIYPLSLTDLTVLCTTAAVCIGYDVIESLRIQGKQGKQRSLTIFKIKQLSNYYFLVYIPY